MYFQMLVIKCFVMRHVIGSQLKCVVSDGETPAPVLPVVALIWTLLPNKLLAAR
jgi:hypothetical protein